MIHGLRWLEGNHPHLGEVIQGAKGLETIQKFTLSNKELA
jgi:cyclophilin family peptidyl-prolyl cis-trans isomerase